VSRQAIVKKENKLGPSFYYKLSTVLASSIKISKGKTCKNIKNYDIYAVDGTYPTFKKALSNDGYKINKNKSSVTPLVSGIMNITENCPVTLDLVKTKDERLAFTEFMKNKKEFEHSLFIFDRGYMSDALIKFMYENKFKFLFRIKENSKYVTSNDQEIIHNFNENSLRIVKYDAARRGLMVKIRR